MPRFQNSPVFNESSIGPGDVSHGGGQESQIINFKETNDDKTHEDEYRGRERSPPTEGKIIRSASGSPIKMHLDLSKILLQRELEQRGKPIYKVSRGNSKSPGAVSGHKNKAALDKLNKVKQSEPSFEKSQTLNLNNIAKSNIKEKKYSDLRNKLATGEAEAKESKGKRRTKEERANNSTLVFDKSRDSIVKKLPKVTQSLIEAHSPLRSEVEVSIKDPVRASKSIFPEGFPSYSHQDSPTRVDAKVARKSTIKSNDLGNSAKYDFSDPSQVKKAFDNAMMRTLEQKNKEAKKSIIRTKKKQHGASILSESPVNQQAVRVQSAYHSPAKKPKAGLNQYSTPSNIKYANARTTN